MLLSWECLVTLHSSSLLWFSEFQLKNYTRVQGLARAGLKITSYVLALVMKFPQLRA